MRSLYALGRGRRGGRRALLVLPVVLVVLALSGCAAPTASYTRFRSQAVSGRIIAAEEVRPEEFINYHAQRDAPRPVRTAVAEELGLGLAAALGNPALPMSASNPVLQVSLRGASGVVRPPANIVLAVDLSGSMNSEDKIGAVRHAVARFVEALDPRDRISLVTFSNGASGIGPRRVGEQRAQILRAVASWSARGGTNLYAGFQEARLLALAGQRARGVSRIVLLSDGIPTAGSTHHVDFISLARQCAAEGISVTTIGLGREIDDRLLSNIARASGGQYHFLDRPDEVERVFAAEIRGLTEAAARDVVLGVQLPAGWRLERSYAESTQVAAGGFIVPVGELSGNEATVLLFELAAPPTHLPGLLEQIVVTAELSTPSSPGPRRAARAGVNVTRTGALPYDPAPGGAVLRNLMLGRAAVALRRADELQRTLRGEMAVTLLETTVGDLHRARARLAQCGEHRLAESLEEPTALLGRTLETLRERVSRRWYAAPMGSSAWADWGPDGAPEADTGCEIPGDCVPLPRSQ